MAPLSASRAREIFEWIDSTSSVDVRRPAGAGAGDYYETLAILVHSAFGLPTRHAPKPLLLPAVYMEGAHPSEMASS